MEKRYDVSQRSKASLNNSVVHKSEKVEEMIQFDEKNTYGPKATRKNPLANVMQASMLTVTNP
jgi:hypothetical protein